MVGLPALLQTSSKTPIEVEGRQLRVNWAQGAMASWKVCSGVSTTPHPPTLFSFRHCTVNPSPFRFP